MMKYLLCLLMAAPILSSTLHAAEPADTTATSTAVKPRSTEVADTLPDQFLKEVVVKSERAWIEGNKAIFLPTKSEKNLANDAASLLERMHIPTVIIDNGQIKSITGKTVSLFINGQEASGIDLSTFWPKLAKRVEYIENPTDPQFKGVDVAINFIMTEYAVGGITRLHGWQELPNYGTYGISSKLVYKRMTYGVQLGGRYSRDHMTSRSGNEKYHNVFYDGTSHESITRDFEGHSVTRDDNADATLSARYRTDKWMVLNNASLSWNRNPGGSTFDRTGWKPEIFDSEFSSTADNSRMLSPQLSGTCAYQVNQKGFVAIDWSYAYARSHSRYAFSADGLSSFFNQTAEDSHSGSATLRSNFRINQKLFVSGSISSSMNWFSTIYTGATAALSKQWRGQTAVTARGTWSFSDDLSLTLRPGVLATYWHINGTPHYRKFEPTAEANIYWGFSSKGYLSGSLYYTSTAPLASQSGNVLLRQTELEWMAGNAALRSSSEWLAMVSAMWLPVNSFRISFSGYYSRTDNLVITDYAAAPSELGGVIKTFANARPFDKYRAGLIFNYSCLGNRMNITAAPELSHYRAHGRYAAHLTSCYAFAKIGYTVGNCEISAEYTIPSRQLANGGMTTIKKSDSFDLGFTYGNGDLLLKVTADNILNKHTRLRTYTDAGVYTSFDETLQTGRKALIILSYTFGYGKKVDRDINISGPSAVQSGVLGSD